MSDIQEVQSHIKQHRQPECLSRSQTAANALFSLLATLHAGARLVYIDINGPSGCATKLSKLLTWTVISTSCENGSKDCDMIQLLESERGRMVLGAVTKSS